MDSGEGHLFLDTRYKTGNKYVWEEDDNPAARRLPLARILPRNRKTTLTGDSDTLRTRTRAGSVGDGYKRIM